MLRADEELLRCFRHCNVQTENRIYRTYECAGDDVGDRILLALLVPFLLGTRGRNHFEALESRQVSEDAVVSLQVLRREK